MTILRTMNATLLGFFLIFSHTSLVFAAEFEFKLHHYLSPRTTAHAQVILPWANRIMAASDGRIEIEIFPAMTLGGKPPQLPRQVRDGLVDMAWIRHSFGNGSFPRNEVFELPGLHQGDSAAVAQAMFAMYNSDLSKDFRTTVALFQHVLGGQAIHMATEEVHAATDLVGKRFTVETRVAAWLTEALGAVPIRKPLRDVPGALADQTVDGAIMPFLAIPGLRLQNLTSFHVEGPNGQRLGSSSFSLIINAERWNALPPDIRKIFRDHSGLAWHQEMGEIWDAAEVSGLKMAKDAGNGHIELSVEEWAKIEAAGDKVVLRWISDMNARGIDGEALYERAKRLISENMSKS